MSISRCAASHLATRQITLSRHKLFGDAITCVPMPTYRLAFQARPMLASATLIRLYELLKNISRLQRQTQSPTQTSPAQTLGFATHNLDQNRPTHAPDTRLNP